MNTNFPLKKFSSLANKFPKNLKEAKKNFPSLIITPKDDERWFITFAFPCEFFPSYFHQSGHLDVVVPPDILNSLETSADESVTNEGGNVQLLCKATGVPEPRLLNHFIKL